MQRYTPVNTKQYRLHTDSGAPNRSVKRKTLNRSISKKLKTKHDKLRLQSMKTQRFTSPNKNLYQVYEKDRALHSSKSKSRKHTKSIETSRQKSRQKSGDTNRKTNRQQQRSRSKNKKSKMKQCIKLLKIPPRLDFKDLATMMFSKFEEVQAYLRPSTPDDPKGTYQLCIRYRQLFGQLVKSMVQQLTSLSDQKQSQIMTNAKSITKLQTSLHKRYDQIDKLNNQNKSLKAALQTSSRIVRQQNACILQMKAKETCVVKLIDAIRKRGIDVQQIYSQDVQTPPPDDSQQASSRDPLPRPNLPYHQDNLNQSY